MDPAAIISAIEAGLKKVGNGPRLVYKRVITKTGSDKAKLLGRPATSAEDTLLTPQPRYFFMASDARLVDRVVPMVANGKQVTGEDYGMIVSPNAVSAEELRNGTVLVMKDAQGNEETFETLLVDDTAAINGVPVLLNLILRSTSRQ